jgi:hypothetical protein
MLRTPSKLREGSRRNDQDRDRKEGAHRRMHLINLQQTVGSSARVCSVGTTDSRTMDRESRRGAVANDPANGNPYRSGLITDRVLIEKTVTACVFGADLRIL